MASRLALLLVLAALPAGVPARAEVAPPGASSCLGCHAPARAGAAIPSLRGRDAGEVAEAMREYHEGTRPATLMNRLARGFSESETRDIAAWIVRQ